MEGGAQSGWTKRSFKLLHGWDVTDQFSSVQLLSCVWLFVTPWTVACQASLSTINSQSSLRLMSIKSVMSSNHLILCRPLFLLPQISPSIKVFSNESVLCMRWPKYWSFRFRSFPPKNTQGWSPSEWTGWITLQSKGLSKVFSKTISISLYENLLPLYRNATDCCTLVSCNFNEFVD